MKSKYFCTDKHFNDRDRRFSVQKGPKIKIILTSRSRWTNSWTCSWATSRNRCRNDTGSSPGVGADSAAPSLPMGMPLRPAGTSQDLRHFPHRNCKKRENFSNGCYSDGEAWGRGSGFRADFSDLPPKATSMDGTTAHMTRRRLSPWRRQSERRLPVLGRRRINRIDDIWCITDKHHCATV